MGELKSPDVLTVRFNINDKSKIEWLWALVRANPKKVAADPELAKYGVDVRMLSWGDPVNENEYVMERIKRYLDFRDRDTLLEEMEKAGTYQSDEYESIDQLGELIEIWEKEASKKYGWQVTAEDLKAENNQPNLERQGSEAQSGSVASDDGTVGTSREDSQEVPSTTGG